MKKPTVVFVTNRYSSVLDLLYSDSDIVLAGVIYDPIEKKSASEMQLFISQHNIPYYSSFDMFGNNYTEKPDFLVIYSFHKILKEQEIRIPNIAAINLHPSLLPLYKGKNPWNEQFEAGETESGFTVHKVTEDVDGGPILLQKRYHIDYNLSYSNIIEYAVKNVGAPLLCYVIKNFKNFNV